jgi:hypothetical protein
VTDIADPPGGEPAGVPLRQGDIGYADQGTRFSITQFPG